MYRTLLFLSVLLIALTACEGSPLGAPDGAAPETRATAEAQADNGEQPVVVYQRAGEAEGDVLEWRLYSSGRGVTITAPAEGDTEVTEVDVDSDAITGLVDDLQAAGFFEEASAGEAECCAENSYVLSVQQDGQVSSMALQAVTPQTSQPRLQSITFVEKFIFEEVTNAGQ